MKAKTVDYSRLVIAQPIPASKLFHVFDDKNRSLCGGFAILGYSMGTANKVKGTEKWQKGEDCKSCFTKADLI